MQQKMFRSKAFIAACMILFAMTAVSYIPIVFDRGNSVTKITLNPPTPNILFNNQKITITFTYATTQPEGVHIFARPISDGSPSANYAASSAPISPTGSGTGTQNFTITSGNITVDQVRFQMYNADQSRLLFEAFAPVHYQFLMP